MKANRDLTRQIFKDYSTIKAMKSKQNQTRTQRETQNRVKKRHQV